MRTKILVLAMLMSFSAIVIAQTTDLVPKKQDMQAKEAMMQKKEFAMQRKAEAMQRMRGAANGLNLTEAQKTSFKEGMIALKKQMQPLRNQLGEADAHQKTLITAEKPDMGAINKNIEKIGEIRVQMAKILVKQRLEMRALLTDEQRLKFDLFRENMKNGKGPKGMKIGKGPMRKHPGMM
jgi:Spy/CpxP family protein refolding chaperone